ncbi:MAG: beta-propeller fold lactonase family protein, partial [Myxococcota bacterium]
MRSRRPERAMFWLVGCAAIAAAGLSCSCSDSSEPDNPAADGGESTGDAASDAGDDPSDGGAVDPPVARLMYISTGNGQRLAVARLEVDGTITRLEELDVTLGENTFAMAYARSARRLYLGVGSDIATFTLDDSGAPSLAGTTPGTGRPVYLATTANDSLLVSAYFGDDLMRVHDVSGAAPHNEVDNLGVADEPHAALVGPGGLIYVPHRNGGTTRWFNVAGNGDLSLVDELPSDPGVGPRHIAFSPDGNYAYVINEFADTVTAHTVAGDGSLSAIQTITTLPKGANGDDNTCADVHVTPDGRFLYGSNRGDDSIAMFAITDNGQLSPLGHVATEERPR